MTVSFQEQWRSEMERTIESLFESEQMCIRCGEYPAARHPRTGKQYKLCIICVMHALVELRPECDNHDQAQDCQESD